MATLTIQTAATPVGELPEMPIDPPLIRDGRPIARGAILTQSADQLVSSGLWTCEPGQFEWTFAWDEFIHALEGEVEIVEEGTDRPVVLRPGDMAHFPRGMQTRWNVKRRLKKFFVLRTPEPLPV